MWSPRVWVAWVASMTVRTHSACGILSTDGHLDLAHGTVSLQWRLKAAVIVPNWVRMMPVPSLSHQICS